MLRVGLTGGIACGKSHVARCWARAGFHLIDLDRLAHEALARGGAAHRDVIAAFGPGIVAPDGAIDRKALGAIVFGDVAARRRLNALVHPRVRAEEARLVSALGAAPEAVIATEAALLVESGVHLRFDRLVVAWCRPEEQVARLMRRDGTDEAGARARIAAQMPVTAKRGFAHYEIDTSGSLDDTDAAAEVVAADLQGLARLGRAAAPFRLEGALGSLFHGPSEGPRGLHPRRVLDELVAAGSLELDPLASALRPPAPGPWLEAARPGEGAPEPATLVAPLVLWALGRRGSDPPFLALAAASLARLTHLDPRPIADACAQALLLQTALTSGAEGLAAPAADHQELVRRFGGHPPSAGQRAVAEAVARHGADVAGARGAAQEAGGDPDLAGMIAGGLAGASDAECDPDLVAAVRGLWSRAYPDYS